jgi:hypothetical protein
MINLKPNLKIQRTPSNDNGVFLYLKKWRVERK